MLVTFLKCWWPIKDVGNRFLTFKMSPTSRKKSPTWSFCHQHDHSVTNIIKLSPSNTHQQNIVTHISRKTVIFVKYFSFWFLVADDPNLIWTDLESRFSLLWHELWNKSGPELAILLFLSILKKRQKYFLFPKFQMFKNFQNQIFPKPSKYFDLLNYFKPNNFFLFRNSKSLLIQSVLEDISGFSNIWKKFGFYFWTNQIRVFLGHADAINLLEVGVEAVKNSFKHTYDI